MFTSAEDSLTELLSIVFTLTVGYKSRADEYSWNGTSRKVLEHQIATHMAILKGVPLIYAKVEEKGVCDNDSALVLHVD